MIFVTVGTHEQQFDRLIRCVDELKRDGKISEEVVMQTGFSTYKPEFCQWSMLLNHKDMQRYMKEARIVITHGGPSSFIAPVQMGKIPIVVPRKKCQSEHVNDHQVSFAHMVKEKLGNIIVVEEMLQLEEVINNYDQLVAEMDGDFKGNNARFCMEFANVVDDLLE